jgi:CrcB protein
MLVNLAGCLALGFIAHLVLETGEFSPWARALLTTGFCGGFTTFSTFAYETVALLEEGSWRRATFNAGASLGLGLLGVVTGAMLARGLLSLLRAGTN